MICPVIPFITNPLPLIELVQDSADKVWVYGLSILNEAEINWKHIRAILRDNFPRRYGAVKAAVFDREHPYWAELRQALSDYSAYDFELSVHF